MIDVWTPTRLVNGEPPEGLASCVHCGGLTFAHGRDGRSARAIDDPVEQAGLFSVVPEWVVRHGYAIESDAFDPTVHNCVDLPATKSAVERRLKLHFGGSGAGKEARR